MNVFWTRPFARITPAGHNCILNRVIGLSFIISSFHHSSFVRDGVVVDAVEVLRFVISALGGQRLRSFLSALGVGIGVAAVILLTSLGEGTRDYIVSQFTQFGTTLIGINPGKVKRQVTKMISMRNCFSRSINL